MSVTYVLLARIIVKQAIMRIAKILPGFIVFFVMALGAGAQTMLVDHFTKVIVSPYVQVVFEQGESESVTINGMLVDSSKLHVEVHNKTLRIYLDGAKDLPKYEKRYNDHGYRETTRLYPNHAVIATVRYRTLKALSLRGEETQLCQSPLTANKFSLWVYGDSKVIFTEMHVRQLRAVIYGDGSVDVKSGKAEMQRFTAYGDGKINTTAISGRSGKVTSFGESEFSLNVSDRIKITAFGEAKVRYMGNPDIVKGIHIGEMDVRKID